MNRYGQTTSITGKSPGDLSSAKLISGNNDRALLPLYYIAYFVIINWSLLASQTLNIDAAMRIPFLLGALFLLSHISFCLQKQYAPAR